MKPLNEFEVSSVAGGLSFRDVASCAISGMKAWSSGKALDVSAALLACEPVAQSFGSAVSDKVQEVYGAFNMKDGQGDISPVGSSVVLGWVSYGDRGEGYWDNGLQCMAD